MRRLILVALAGALVAGCGASQREAEQTASNRAQRAEKVERFVATGPRVVSEASIEGGTLRTIEVPRRGITGAAAEVATCLLFIHHGGASSMACPGEPSTVFASEL